jgi:hypothetical protein
VLQIGDTLDEGRGEPLLALGRADPPDADTDRREPPSPRSVVAAPISPREAPVGSRQRARPFGPIGSLLLHLLPLLLLLQWPMRPPDQVIPIPVRLVFEPPPVPKPAPQAKPAPPKPETKPPKGRIASEDIGGKEAKGQDEAKEEPAPAEKPPAPAAQQEALAVPRPLPEPAPKPVEPPSDHFARPQPKPKPMPPHPPRQRGQAHLLLLPRPGRIPGPAATRDEYLAYIAALTRRHLDLLPLTLVGARRGETIIDVLVMDNGTIAMLRVGHSSGYPDIDERIERMISAVGRFPPLPQWFQGSSMQLEFRLRFPEALQN